MNADTSSQMVQAFKLTHLLGTFPLHRYLRAWPGALYVGQKGRCVSHQVAPAMWMYFVKRMEDGKILLVSAIKRRWGIKSLYAERRDYFFFPRCNSLPDDEHVSANRYVTARRCRLPRTSVASCLRWVHTRDPFSEIALFPHTLRGLCLCRWVPEQSELWMKTCCCYCCQYQTYRKLKASKQYLFENY
jgi:hypothetical protein